MSRRLVLIAAASVLVMAACGTSTTSTTVQDSAKASVVTNDRESSQTTSTAIPISPESIGGRGETPDASVVAAGACGGLGADAGLIPPFFRIDLMEFTEAIYSDESTSYVAVSRVGAHVAVDSPYVHSLIARAIDLARTPGSDRVIVAGRDGVVEFGSVLSDAGEVDLVGICVDTWEEVLHDFAASIGLPPATVWSDVAADPSGRLASELESFSIGLRTGESLDPAESWADVDADSRVYVTGVTPDEVMSKLVAVRVAVRFPDEWRSDEILLCPRAGDAWNVCVSSQATTDGHAVAWTVFAEQAGSLTWYLVPSPAGFDEAVPYLEIDPVAVADASASDGVLVLHLPDTADVEIAALGEQSATRSPNGWSRARSVSMSAADFAESEAAEAQVAEPANSASG